MRILCLISISNLFIIANYGYPVLAKTQTWLIIPNNSTNLTMNGVGGKCADLTKAEILYWIFLKQVMIRVQM